MDLPVEVDDEYWENENPALAFRQPPGKPALVTAFNAYIKLTQVISFALRTIVRANAILLKVASLTLIGLVRYRQDEVENWCAPRTQVERRCCDADEYFYD